MISSQEPGFRVSVAKRSDVARTVPCMTRAFWEFPETRHLLPTDRVRRRVLPRYLGSDSRDASRFSTLLIAESGVSCVGAAAWLPPEGYPVSTRRAVAEALHLVGVAPWAISALREAKRGQAANRERHASCPPHYWLRSLGVDPSWQGRGIGTALVSPMLHRADRERRGAFLFTATEENAAWYESFGFTVLSTYHPTATWPLVWAMWREPNAGA